MISAKWVTNSLTMSMTLRDLRIACCTNYPNEFFRGVFILGPEELSTVDMPEDKDVTKYLESDFVNYCPDDDEEMNFGIKYNRILGYEKMPLRMPFPIDPIVYKEAEKDEEVYKLASIWKVTADRNKNYDFWCRFYRYWYLDAICPLTMKENEKELPDFGLRNHIIGGSFAITKVLGKGTYKDIDYFTTDFNQFIYMVIDNKSDIIAHNNVLSTDFEHEGQNYNVVCLLNEYRRPFTVPFTNIKLMEYVHHLIDISCTACFIVDNNIYYNSYIETNTCVGRVTKGRLDKYSERGWEFIHYESKRSVLYG